MSEKNGIITWDDSDSSSKAKAMEEFSDSMNAYDGISKANHRTFLDIEPNISARPGYNRYDYEAFRPGERVPKKQKHAIKMCMEAYDKVGIIRNIIDLMGDFGSQGIDIVHENKSVEKFYKQWFKKVDGKERSERFLNNLYRTGQVFIYRSSAKVTPDIVRYVKTMGNDITVKLPSSKKDVIPWRYNFFNPLTVDFKDGDLNLFLGRRKFEISSKSFLDNFQKDNIPLNTLDTLPTDLKRKIQNGEKMIPLDEDRLCVYYYKKDDWQQWANPLTYAILDDIIMLEKMRLADLSALDGAISNIRLWTLGSLDHKILPTRDGVNKLRNILAGNVGGGTMELVWGPDLKYTESNSQVYKFLGSEKYQSVLNSIYAGLGVPPTLTGMAGQSGGFTNNFISLKTLVERLQYGRDQLTKFWVKEAEIVRRAMGFRKPAHIVYDQMSLSDEAAEKNLLIQLADRDIISHETILDRFKEIPAVEKVRLNRENKERDNESMPEKVGPFHPPKEEFEEGPENQNGRPKFKKDEEKRKKRVDKPKTKPGVAELFVWASESFDQISDIVNKSFLAVSNKKNMRQLTKGEVADLEKLKMHVLTNIDPQTKVSAEMIRDIVASNKKMPAEFSSILKDRAVSINTMSMDEYKRSVLGLYVEFTISDNKNKVFANFNIKDHKYGIDLFGSKEDAEKEAERLGIEGTHTYLDEETGELYYAPGKMDMNVKYADDPRVSIRKEKTPRKTRFHKKN